MHQAWPPAPPPEEQRRRTLAQDAAQHIVLGDVAVPVLQHVGGVGRLLPLPLAPRVLAVHAAPRAGRAQQRCRGLGRLALPHAQQAAREQLQSAGPAVAAPHGCAPAEAGGGGGGGGRGGAVAVSPRSVALVHHHLRCADPGRGRLGGCVFAARVCRATPLQARRASAAPRSPRQESVFAAGLLPCRQSDWLAPPGRRPSRWVPHAALLLQTSIIHSSIPLTPHTTGTDDQLASLYRRRLLRRIGAGARGSVRESHLCTGFGVDDCVKEGGRQCGSGRGERTERWAAESTARASETALRGAGRVRRRRRQRPLKEGRGRQGVAGQVCVGRWRLLEVVHLGRS